MVSCEWKTNRTWCDYNVFNCYCQASWVPVFRFYCSNNADRYHLHLSKAKVNYTIKCSFLSLNLKMYLLNCEQVTGRTYVTSNAIQTGSLDWCNFIVHRNSSYGNFYSINTEQVTHRAFCHQKGKYRILRRIMWNWKLLMILEFFKFSSEMWVFRWAHFKFGQHLSYNQ